ncbi:centrosomal protein of 68 kDa isoform 1-T4 [Anomaloglossus baeobatrachus]|uniref:centrosomal protein of 68 kDa n=1 Tax=Anomaloglossus baeobatrachus TaxID=238106 RepID=UPI003F4F4B0B
MASCREKIFPSNTSGYRSIYSAEDKPSGADPTRTMSDDSDDLPQDRPRSRTILDSSCSACNISVAHSKYRPHLGACRSLKSNFNNTSCSEKSQTFAEQYWACAIPNTRPPRPDRTSPDWDPNKEYQDLLDYTYPLNPKYFLNKDEEDEADAFLHDSGVDLDSYNASSDSKFGSFTSTYRDDHKAKTDQYLQANNPSLPFAFSTPLLKRTGYSGLQNPPGSSNVSGEFSPYASKLDLAKECTASLSPRKYDVIDKIFSSDKSSRGYSDRSEQFLSTTSVLPLHKDLDTDEEYLSLPPTLKELEALATHLKDLSITVGDKDQGSGAKTKSRVSDDGPKDQKYNFDFVNHDEPKINRFSSLRDMLDGRVTSEVLDISGCTSVKETKSLVQRIQRFCQHLDRLIEWLYSVAEVTDNWTAPKPNVESIQLALSLYLKLKKDVAEQQVLANTVIRDGESLERCLAFNSSALKDTLTLISKQSGELERHAERLYASVLEAMDTITEESLARNGNLKQRVSLEMESS